MIQEKASKNVAKNINEVNNNDFVEQLRQNAIDEAMAKQMMGNNIPSPNYAHENNWDSVYRTNPINKNMSSYGYNRPNQCKEGNNEFGSTPVWNNGFDTYCANSAAQSPITGMPHYNNFNGGKTETKNQFDLDLKSNMTYKHFSSPLYEVDIPDVILESYIGVSNIYKLNGARTELFSAIRRHEERYHNNMFIYGTDPDLEFINNIINQLCDAFKIDKYEFGKNFKDPIMVGFATWVFLDDIIKTLDDINRHHIRPMETFGFNIPSINDGIDIEKTGEPIIPRTDVDVFLASHKKEFNKALDEMEIKKEEYLSKLEDECDASVDETEKAETGVEDNDFGM